MRTEDQVLNQLITFARNNEMVRAVWMNGSRVNPSVHKDPFCDYDVVFAVTDPLHFKQDRNWIPYFGELVILQQNDWSENGIDGYIFLMLFSDGVRIDLSFDPLEPLAPQLSDSLTVVLLDKDNRIPNLPPPSEASYMPQKPTRKEYDEIANEFWWCSTNVAKGIWRDELTYTKYMYDNIVQSCLVQMITWYVAQENGWTVNSGFHGKWIQKYLQPVLYESLKKTYADGNYEAMWNAMFEAGRLFRTIGTAVAEALGYHYPLEDEQRVTEYWRRVRDLPKEAEDFR